MELWLGQACGKDMKVWQLDQALASAHAMPADSSSPMMGWYCSNYDGCGNCKQCPIIDQRSNDASQSRSCAK